MYTHIYIYIYIYNNGNIYIYIYIYIYIISEGDVLFRGTKCVCDLDVREVMNFSRSS